MMAMFPSASKERILDYFFWIFEKLNQYLSEKINTNYVFFLNICKIYAFNWHAVIARPFLVKAWIFKIKNHLDFWRGLCDIFSQFSLLIF